jgi:POT family proton-dependent oligopeptide transporter
MDPTIFYVGIGLTFFTMIPVVWQLMRHPKGLFILFFAEMWERFSFYGMRGLLIFYLTQHFLMDDTFANGQYATYNALVYLLPLVGGVLADRYIGTRKAIAFGAILLVLGHFTMGLEGPAAVQVLKHDGNEYTFDVAGRGDNQVVRLVVNGQKYEYGPTADGGLEIKGLPPQSPLPAVLAANTYQLDVRPADRMYTDILYLALALIIMGVGFLKANISSIVGQLYEQTDQRRDAGFTLYYYGINLGAFWATIATGALNEAFGWWAGFGAAGIGMLAGLLVFGIGKPWLEGKGEPPNPERLAKPVIGPINTEWLIYIGGILGVGAIWLVVQNHHLVEQVLPWASVVMLVYLVYFMMTQCTWVESQRLILAIVLIASSAVFWTLFEQAGSSLNQFAQRHTVLTVGGVTLSSPQVQSFNAGMILVLAPIFAFLWAVLGRLNLDPNPALKFGLALLQAGAGFYVLVWGASFVDDSFRVPLFVLALTYLLHTTGELCISPVGLSQMTKLAPSVLISTVMATWFLASSIAHIFAGFLAKMTAATTVAGHVLDPSKAFVTYMTTFEFIGQIGLAAGAVLIILSPILRYLAHDVTVRTQPAE